MTRDGIQRAVLEQRNRSFLPLTNVPGLDGDYYADLRSITYVDRRSLDARVASMSVTGLERLQDQIADFFIRIKIDDERIGFHPQRRAEEKSGIAIPIAVQRAGYLDSVRLVSYTFTT